MKRITFETFVERAKTKHGNKYQYVEETFKGTAYPITIICELHGEFTQRVHAHLAGQGCSKCAHDQTSKRKQMTTSDFIEHATQRHGNRYDYTNTIYTRSTDKLSIKCPKHGIFEQRASHHLEGRGCPSCAHHQRSASQHYTYDDFMNKASEVHNNKYTYHKSSFTQMNNPTTISCPIHGKFDIIPNYHMAGTGCPKCGRKQLADSRRITQQDFLSKAKKIHGNEYDYTNSVYKSYKDRITIKCKKHGYFSVIAGNHLMGGKCPDCRYEQTVSDEEKELRAFITSHYFGEILTSHRKLIYPYELDIYLPDLKLAFEYCGLYWHSEKGGKDKQYHLNKHKLCDEAGVRLITIFSDEWQQKREIVESTIKHFLGKSDRGVGGRTVSIKEIDWKTAKDFLNKHHLMGAGAAGKTKLGAFTKGGDLCGVMVFGSPANEQGDEWIVEMKRYVSDGKNNAGVASKMFKHAIKNYGYTRVTAFVDRRWFTGSFKSMAKFQLIRHTTPSLFWTDFTHRYHRRKYSKIKPPVGQSKQQYLYDTYKLSRIWDCGKSVMEWNRNE